MAIKTKKKKLIIRNHKKYVGGSPPLKNLNPLESSKIQINKTRKNLEKTYGPQYLNYTTPTKSRFPVLKGFSNRVRNLWSRFRFNKGSPYIKRAPQPTPRFLTPTKIEGNIEGNIDEEPLYAVPGTYNGKGPAIKAKMVVLPPIPENQTNPKKVYYTNKNGKLITPLPTNKYNTSVVRNYLAKNESYGAPLNQTNRDSKLIYLIKKATNKFNKSHPLLQDESKKLTPNEETIVKTARQDYLKNFINNYKILILNNPYKDVNIISNSKKISNNNKRRFESYMKTKQQNQIKETGLTKEQIDEFIETYNQIKIPNLTSKIGPNKLFGFNNEQTLKKGSEVVSVNTIARLKELITEKTNLLNENERNFGFDPVEGTLNQKPVLQMVENKIQNVSTNSIVDNRKLSLQRSNINTLNQTV
jgi:hypothetical protein